jgi:hypothetical protein
MSSNTRPVSQADAIQIALAHATASGWPISPPIIVRRMGLLPFGLGRQHWCVMSNGGDRGGGFRVEVNARSGKIELAGFLDR